MDFNDNVQNQSDGWLIRKTNQFFRFWSFFLERLIGSMKLSNIFKHEEGFLISRTMKLTFCFCAIENFSKNQFEHWRKEIIEQMTNRSSYLNYRNSQWAYRPLVPIYSLMNVEQHCIVEHRPEWFLAEQHFHRALSELVTSLRSTMFCQLHCFLKDKEIIMKLSIVNSVFSCQRTSEQNRFLMNQNWSHKKRKSNNIDGRYN